MIEEALIKYLSEHTLTKAILDDRYFPDVLPQPWPKFPAVAYQLISDPRDYTTNGESGPAFAVYQFRFCGTTRAQARLAAEAARSILSGFRGTLSGQKVQGIFLDNSIDQHEGPAGKDQLELYSRLLDFRVVYETTPPTVP